jgi:hypothetical protein
VTTEPRPIPAHGTYARANGSPGYRKPCKCDACVQKRRVVRKRLNVNRQLGRPNLVDATPARQHLDLLRQDMSWPGIAEATGCNRDTLAEIHNGTKTRITSVTHRKILAVRPGTQRTGTLCIDATGTRRRIQALQTEGHSLGTIAAAVDTTRWRIGLIAAGQATVTQAIADRIADAYREFSTTPAPNDRTAARARSTAAAKNWHGRDFWDDVDRIDDPDFDPASLTEPPKYMRLGEDALWLREQGYTRKQIAHRLGESVDYIDQSIKRYLAATGTADEQAVA